MNNSIRYIKSKIDSKNLIRLKDVVDLNPKLIILVNPRAMHVFISTGSKSEIEVLLFTGESWWQVEEILKEEIKTRTDPDERFEYWECLNEDGVFSIDIQRTLLTIRKDIEACENKKETINKRALTELCNANKIPVVMGELLLSELRLSINPEDEPIKNQARLLKLI